MREIYGVISDGKLVVTGPGYPNAKPVVYEDVPLFDQETQYVVQLPPTDAGSHIYMGVEVRDVDDVEQMGEAGEEDVPV